VQQHAAHYNPFIISMFISTFGQDEGPIKLPASGVILTGAGAHKKKARREEDLPCLFPKEIRRGQQIKVCDLTHLRWDNLLYRFLSHNYMLFYQLDM